MPKGLRTWGTRPLGIDVSVHELFELEFVQCAPDTIFFEVHIMDTSQV